MLEAITCIYGRPKDFQRLTASSTGHFCKKKCIFWRYMETKDGRFRLQSRSHDIQGVSGKGASTLKICIFFGLQRFMQWVNMQFEHFPKILAGNRYCCYLRLITSTHKCFCFRKNIWFCCCACSSELLSPTCWLMFSLYMLYLYAICEQMILLDLNNFKAIFRLYLTLIRCGVMEQNSKTILYMLPIFNGKSLLGCRLALAKGNLQLSSGTMVRQ